ncbi:tetratricopeptide repeat protein [Kosakonia sp. BK9b]|uniref:tetratricopeptide repeat protein n=1 Tax=Kosakonia sp. TaxID=1916651 RepID=UPI002897BCC7|nr:tetratricopeptide repeat protein [Kosakonia sp.]
MDNRLYDAIALRQQGEHQQSRQQLQALTQVPELRARALLNMAWSYDNEGKEQEAEQHYLAALEAGLENDDDRFEAQFGLACTLRCLGKYQQAKALFEAIMIDWPQATEVRPFYALCLYNLGEYECAVSLLLTAVAQHPDPRTAPYQQVLHYYAQNPNQRG